MNHELFNQQLVEITKKIVKLGSQHRQEDNDMAKKIYHYLFVGGDWPTKKTCLQRKIIWESIKKDLERKINLLQENQISINNDAFALLLSKFYDKLSQIEEKISLLDATLKEFQEKERKAEVRRMITLVILVIILFGLGFLAYQRYQGRH